MKIRIPPSLKGEIEDAAKRNNRSMNAEIVTRLEQSFGSSPYGSGTLDEFLGQLDSGGRDTIMHIYSILPKAPQPAPAPTAPQLPDGAPESALTVKPTKRMPSKKI